MVDVPGLQPAKSLLLPAAQVDENSQAALSVVESCPICPENIQKLFFTILLQDRLFSDKTREQMLQAALESQKRR